MVQAFGTAARLKSSYENISVLPARPGFQVPGELVKAGRNVVFDPHSWPRGRAFMVRHERDAVCRFRGRSNPNEWRYKIERGSRSDGRIASRAAESPDAQLQVTPGCLYNAMIRRSFCSRCRRDLVSGRIERAAFARIRQKFSRALIQIGEPMERRPVSVLHRATRQRRPSAAIAGRRATGPNSRGAIASVATSAEHGPGRDDRHRRGERYPSARTSATLATVWH